MDGVFEFTITGPPGVYAVLASTNLVTWSEIGAVTNRFGSIGFLDSVGHSLRFYRARQ